MSRLYTFIPALFLALFLISPNASAQTHLYVDSSVTASGAGTSWSSAYKTLNEALTTVNAASTTTRYVVRIAKGTYYPAGVQSSTDRDSAFFLGRAGVVLQGGYPAGGGTPSNIAANPTILSGNIGSTTASFDNSTHILIAANIGAGTDTILISGLRFTDANASSINTKTYNTRSILRNSGGAVYNAGVGARMVFDSCSFYGNTATLNGGAVYNDNSQAFFRGCSFSNNTATGPLAANLGGAIYWNNTTAAAAGISGCTFSGNRADEGGAVYCAHDAGGASIRSSIFTANTATSGAGIYAYRSPGASGGGTLISGCSFTGNTTAISPSSAGGGINSVGNSSWDTIMACSFSGNTATGGGGLNAFKALVRRCSFNGNLANWTHGGGAAISEGGIDSCTFSRNKSLDYGGGLSFRAAPASTLGAGGLVLHCSFTGDTAIDGGGGMHATGAVTISRCSFRGNVASIGGGLYLFMINGAQVIWDTVQGNVALHAGGGIYLQHQSASGTGALIGNSLITGNRAGNRGGGLVDSFASPNIVNCSFAGDTATTANGIYNYASSPDIRNTIIWEGTAGIVNVAGSAPLITYSTVQGGHAGTGNLAVDPVFASPAAVSAAPTTAGDYSLAPCSPAINSGTFASGSGWIDLAGNNRFIGSAIDQGAFEYQHGYPLTGPAAVCLNSSGQYSHLIGGGTWSTSNTSVATISATGVLTAVATGTVNVIYTISSPAPCAGVTSLPVTINALPAIPTITLTTGFNDTLCPNGGYADLNALPLGGTWTASDTNIAKVSGIGYITAAGRGGQDTIYYTVTNSAGCKASAMYAITVMPPIAAPAITGPDSVCHKDTVQLGNAITGGAWSSAPLPGISASGLFYANNPGSNLIIYTVTDTFGCSETRRDTVFVRPLPTIFPNTGDSAACLKGGAAITLGNPAAGGVWKSAHPSIATISSSGVVTPVSAGMADIWYVLTTAGGCSDSSRKRMLVTGIDNSVTVSGNTITANESGAGSLYEWLDCGNGFASLTGLSAANTSFTPAVSGQYAVSILKNGCRDTSVCTAITIGGTGISPEAMPALAEVYPNPASGMLHIRVFAPVPGMTIAIRDITGREILKATAHAQQTVLDISDLTPGIYRVEMRYAGRVETKKICIVR